MLVVRHVKRPAPRLDEEELLGSLEPAGPRPSRSAADDTLRETLRPVTAIDRDCYVGVVDRPITSWTLIGN
jgi:hypothetical protein